jgi:hypothetical protein
MNRSNHPALNSFLANQPVTDERLRAAQYVRSLRLLRRKRGGVDAIAGIIVTRKV